MARLLFGCLFLFNFFSTRLNAQVVAAALNLDGGNDYITTSSVSFGTNWSVEGWIRATNPGSPYWNAVVGQCFYNNGQGFVVATLGTTLFLDSPQGLHIQANITASVWTHFAVTYNNGIFAFYVNGILVGTQIISAYANATTSFYIGARTSNSGVGLADPFSGDLDEIRIWNTTRTQCEILSYMNCEIPTVSAGLISNYHFNQGFYNTTNTGVNSLLDVSGYSHNGTLSNFAYTGLTSNWTAPGAVTTGSIIPFSPLPEINVKGNGVSISDGDISPSLSDYTDFGTTGTRTFVVESSGTHTLNLGSPFFVGGNSGDFTLTVPPSTLLAASSGTTSFVVGFTPTSLGVKTTTVYIYNSDCNEPVYKFAITATATAGEALSFDGVNDYVETNANLAELAQADFTIETWIKTTGISQGIINCANGNTLWETGEKSLYINAGGIPRFVGFGNGYIPGNIAVNDGAWHHIAVVWDYQGGMTGTGKMYIDGVNHTGGVSYVPANVNVGTFKFGQQNYNNYTPEAPNYFNGQMDEVRIWNRALCLDEILNNMNCELPNPTSQPGLNGYYKFNSGVAFGVNTGVTTALDNASFVNNGTLNNFALIGASSNWYAPGAVPSGSVCSVFLDSEINLTGKGISIQDGDTTPSLTDNTDFGSMCINAPVTHTFSIQNLGTSTLAVSSITMSGTGATSFNVGSLSPASPIAAGSSSTFTVTFAPSSPGVKTATLTISSNDCSEAVYDVVITGTCNALPVVSIGAVNNPICSGSTATLSALGADTYTWSPGSVVGGTITLVPAITTTFTAFGTNTLTGCTSTNVAALTVTVNTVPTITSSPNATLCPLGSTTLSAGVALSYTWSPAASLSSANGATVTASPLATTIYTITGANASGCTSTTTVQVFVDVNPTITISPNATLCPLGSTTLTTGGAISYTWSPASTLSSASAQTVTANPSATTIYTITGSNANGCMGTNTVQVFVDSNPIVTSSPDATLCPAGSTTLTAGGAVSYTWSPAATLSSATGASVSAAPSVTTIYTVTGSNSNGCIATSTLQITLDVNPTLTITPSSTLCPLGSTTLTAGGALSYTWSPAASLSSATGATVTASPLATTIYTITGANASGCTSTATVQVFVDVNPIITISPNATLCPLGSTTLTTGGAISYTWSPAATLSSASAQTVTANPSATTIYTITGSNANGCIGTNTVQVFVDVNPTITISPNATLCPLGSTTLTAGGAVSYTWSPAATLSSATGASVSAAPSVTTIYTVTGANSNGCINTASVQVFVDANPIISASPNASICPSTTTALTASGAVSYTWSPAATLSSANGASVTALPTALTIYTVTGSNSNGCLGTASVQVSIYSSPTITGSADTTVCAYSTATLIAGGGVSYTWSPSSSLSSASAATVTATPMATTIYTITGVNATGCPATHTISVTVAPNPTVTVANATMCIGTSTLLSASGATSYTWSPASSLSSASLATVTASPSVTTVYTIKGSTGACTHSTTATVSVISFTTGLTATSNIYCVGGTAATLTANSAGTYSWSPGFGLNTTSGASVIASPSVTTTYTVTGYVGFCPSTAVMTVSVTPPSSLNIGSTTTVICPNGSGTTLTASGALTYTWMPGFVTTPTLLVNPPATTSYTVTGQNSAGCFRVPAVITISVTPVINPGIIASSPSVCIGSTVSISATPVGGGYTYTWQPASTIQGSSHVSTITAGPTTPGTVVYTLTVSNGLCAETKTVSLLVLNCIPPTTSFTTLGNDSICTHGCVSFAATSTGIQPFTYQWQFPGGTPPTSTLANPTICYASAGDYAVSLITFNAFGSDTVFINNFINVADTPAVVKAFGDTSLLVGQTATIRATGGLTYVWSPNNSSIACATCSNTVVQPTVTTQYIVTGYSSPYCGRKDTVLVRVDFICGDFFVPNAFSPNGDGLNDEVNIHGFCIGTYNLQIFNRWGEKVFETKDRKNSWDGTFRGKPLDMGVFVYKVDGITIEGRTFVKEGNISLIR